MWTNSSFRLVCSGLYEKQRQYLARFLKRGSYQAFADYLSNFCDAYTAAGLPVYAISPANEPEYAASWNSCLWLPGTTTLGPFIVNNLGPKLRQTHPETRIIFGENAQWSAILGFIMGSKNYVRDILNLNPKSPTFPSLPPDTAMWIL